MAAPAAHAEITIKPETFVYVVNSLREIRGGARRAMASAINDTASKARTRTVRGILEHVAIKRDEISRNVRLFRASVGNLIATIAITGKRLRLIAFGAKERRKKGGGVYYRIAKGGGRRFFKGAFIDFQVGSAKGQGNRATRAARIISRLAGGDTAEDIDAASHVGVFVRKGKDRLPIREAYGLSVVGAFEGAKGLLANVVGEANEGLEKRLLSKVDWLIAQRTQAIADDASSEAA